MTDLTKGIIEINGFTFRPGTRIEQVLNFFGTDVRILELSSGTEVRFLQPFYITENLYSYAFYFGKDGLLNKFSLIPVAPANLKGDPVGISKYRLSAAKQWLNGMLTCEPNTTNDSCVYYEFPCVDYYASLRTDLHYGLVGGEIEVTFCELISKDDKEFGFVLAPKQLVKEKRMVRFMYREESDNPQDSGWRFFSGDETDDFVNNPDNIGIYDIKTIIEIDKAIVPYLDSPYGSVYEREEITNEFSLSRGNYNIISAELKVIIDKLNKQGKMNFLEGAISEQIVAFEKQYNITLPLKFKEWLRFSDGGELFLPAGIQLYGVENKPLIEVTSEDRPSDNYIVIGALASGDTILCEKAGEQISIYNIEGGRIEGDEIYTDFFAFLNSLYDLLGIGEWVNLFNRYN